MDECISIMKQDAQQKNISIIINIDNDILIITNDIEYLKQVIIHLIFFYIQRMTFGNLVIHMSLFSNASTKNISIY